MKTDFVELLVAIRNGDEKKFEELLHMYKPLLTHESVIDGVYDEDLYQELCLIFWKCARQFEIEKAQVPDNL